MRGWLNSTITLLLLGGCGWYTNIPAQIVVRDIEPSTVTVEYSRVKNEAAGAGKEFVAKYTQPTITFAGEPGSIGATYTDAKITYFDVGVGGTLATSSVKIKNNNLKLYATIRVNSSAMREDYASSYQELDKLEQKKLIIGTAKWMPPIITKDVIEFGMPDAPERRAQIFAQIILSGVDDARWPQMKEIVIPIVFVGSTL